MVLIFHLNIIINAISKYIRLLWTFTVEKQYERKDFKNMLRLKEFFFICHSNVVHVT